MSKKVTKHGLNERAMFTNNLQRRKKLEAQRIIALADSQTNKRNK